MSIELKIASPCEESWQSMQGDGRVRFCARCRLNVFNVKELSEVELRALLVKTEGKLCGRVFQRQDGTVLTRDCPRGVARLRRKALGALAMAATLAAVVIGWRSDAERSCATGEDAGWFSRLFDQRFIDAREALRETRTFGPLIDELSPPASKFTMGRMLIIQKIEPAGVISPPTSPY